MLKIENTLINLIGIFVAYSEEVISKETNQTLSRLEVFIINRIIRFNYFNENISIQYFEEVLEIGWYKLTDNNSDLPNAIIRLEKLGFITIDENLKMRPTTGLIHSIESLSSTFYFKQEKRRADIIAQMSRRNFDKLNLYQKFNFLDPLELDLNHFTSIMELELYYKYCVTGNFKINDVYSAAKDYINKKCKWGEIVLHGDYYMLRGEDEDIIKESYLAIDNLTQIIKTPRVICQDIINLVLTKEQKEENSLKRLLDWEAHHLHYPPPSSFMQCQLNLIWYAAKKEYKKKKQAEKK